MLKFYSLQLQTGNIKVKKQKAETGSPMSVSQPSRLSKNVTLILIISKSMLHAVESAPTPGDPMNVHNVLSSSPAQLL